MHYSSRLHRPVVVFVVAVLSIAWAACQAAADEPLRWRFTAGEKLNYQIIQSMDMDIQAGAQGQIKTAMTNQMDIGWQVEGVNEAGDAQIVQSIGRVQLKVDGPPGQSFAYDTNSEEAPQGLAAMVAPSFEAMTTGNIQFTVNSHGEVSAVQVSDEMAAAMQKLPAGPMGDAAVADQLKKLPSQLMLTLPAGDAAPGAQWTYQFEMENAMMGKQVVDTTYVWQGTKDVDGTTYALIQPSLKMGNAAGGQTVQINVKDQKSGGEILFDQAAGRLHSSNLQHDMSLELTMMGQTMPAIMKNVTQVKLTPAQ